MTELIQLHVLMVLLRLKLTPLKYKGAQTLAADATVAVPLLRLAQQYMPVQESVVPLIAAVQAVVNGVAAVML